MAKNKKPRDKSGPLVGTMRGDPEKKLREAAYFLYRLGELNQPHGRDPEFVDYYLSAFLNACYSFFERCSKENSQAYSLAKTEWKSELGEHATRLVASMRNDRAWEVHHGESDRERVEERIRLGQGISRVGHQTHIAAWSTGAQPVEILWHTYRLRIIGGNPMPMIQACSEYLSILQNFLVMFRAKHPIGTDSKSETYPNRT